MSQSVLLLSTDLRLILRYATFQLLNRLHIPAPL